MDPSNPQAFGIRPRRKVTQTDSSNPRFCNTRKPWSDGENAALLRLRTDPSHNTYKSMEPIFGRSAQALRLQVFKLNCDAARASKRRARRDSVIHQESASSREATPATPRQKIPTIKIYPRKAWAAINSSPAAAPARPPIKLDLRLARFRTQVTSRPPIWLNLKRDRFRKGTTAQPDENEASSRPTKVQTGADANLSKASDALFSFFEEPEEESEPADRDSVRVSVKLE